MDAQGIHIVALGARTPLGHCFASSAAAVRAELSHAREHPRYRHGGGEPLLGHFDEGLDPALAGAERLWGLAQPALRECSQLLADLPAAHRRVGLYLGLPEVRPGFDDETAARFARLLVEDERQRPAGVSELHRFGHGHAAGLEAFAAAGQCLRRGDAELCIVGGVDSYFEGETLAWLDRDRRLAGTEARSAFVPGEAAGFCLLMSTRLCQWAGLPSLSRVMGIGLAREPHPRDAGGVCLGRGLDDALRQAVEALADGAVIEELVGDLNGERHRSDEWGFACLRRGGHYADPTAYRAPATCWGDVGAASGPLFAMLACEAARRGYAAGPLSMVWAGSDSGLRAAAVLRADGGGRREGRRHA